MNKHPKDITPLDNSAKTAGGLTKSQRTNARRAARTPEQILEDRNRLRPNGVKTCPRCDRELPLSHFSTDKYRADGLMGMCMACWAVYRKS